MPALLEAGPAAPSADDLSSMLVEALDAYLFSDAPYTQLRVCPDCLVAAGISTTHELFATVLAQSASPDLCLDPLRPLRLALFRARILSGDLKGSAIASHARVLLGGGDAGDAEAPAQVVDGGVVAAWTAALVLSLAIGEHLARTDAGQTVQHITSRLSALGTDLPASAVDLSAWGTIDGDLLTVVPSLLSSRKMRQFLDGALLRPLCVLGAPLLPTGPGVRPTELLLYLTAAEEDLHAARGYVWRQ